MNRINPLHIILVLLLVLAIFIFKLSSAKEDLSVVKSELSKTVQLATELTGLQKVYADKKRVRNALKRVLKQHTLTSVNIEQKVTKSGIRLSSKMISLGALNSLMGKILNGSYKIASLKIRRLSDSTASIVLDIKW